MGRKAGEKMSVRIVHTITKLEFGGAQQNTLYTLNNIPAGFEGYLVCGKGGILDEEAKESTGFDTRFCPFLKRKISPLFDLMAFIWMYFYFLKEKPDIVHSHSSKAGIITRWAARFAGVKHIIHTFHGFGFTPLQSKLVRNLFIFLEKATARITDKLIVVSKANLDTAMELHIGQEEKYQIIRSGIDFSKFEKNLKYDNIKNELGISAEKKIIGNVSCFKPQKGLFDYIKTCRLLKEKGDFAFILVGDGDLRDQLEESVRDSGLQDCFFMTGWRDDIDRIIPQFDIMLHTAYFEGLARVFLESMACSVPIVATAVDGAWDVIEDGVNGYLVKNHNIDQLAECSWRLLQDDDFCDKMGRAGREKLKTEFNIKTMSRTLNDLYENLERKE